VRDPTRPSGLGDVPVTGAASPHAAGAVSAGEEQPIPGLTIHEELGQGAHAVVYRARRYGVD
jgi:hypothetical protein